MDHETTALTAAVQRNCDVSDARYAGCYTMCVYLLKMREYYRWRHGIGFGQRLAMDQVAEWVQRTEADWEQLDGSEFAPLPVGGAERDVFDDIAVNRALADDGLVFGSGIGRFGKPVFFLAREIERRVESGLTVHMVGEELARELAAPPAMIRDDRIFIRRESLERTLREMVEEWRWHRRPGAMMAALTGYGFEVDEDAAMARLIDDQVAQLVAHEIGEYAAGRQLGEAWDRRLLQVSGSHEENLMRAARDWWADCHSLLPRLLQDGRDESVHFFFAALTPLRRLLFPGLLEAYRTWASGGGRESLVNQTGRGAEHWPAVAAGLLVGDPGAPRADIEARVSGVAL